jgi:hypothetical protein
MLVFRGFETSEQGIEKFLFSGKPALSAEAASGLRGQ